MKQAKTRIYEIEYINKIYELLNSGIGRTFNEICSIALYVGIDELYSQYIDKKERIELAQELEGLTKKIIEIGRIINEKEKESLTIEYVNRQMIGSLINMFKDLSSKGVIDIESYDLGLYDALPDKYEKLFEDISKDMDDREKIGE